METVTSGEITTGGLVRLDESLLTSVSQSLKQNKIRAYPVPAKDFITVESIGNKLLSMEMVDSFGRIVEKPSVDSNHHTTFPVSGLARGIYHIRITLTNGEVVNQRILLQ